MANGLEGLRGSDADRSAASSSRTCARPLSGLWVPSTGIVDFGKVGRRHGDTSCAKTASDLDPHRARVRDPCGARGDRFDPCVRRWRYEIESTVHLINCARDCSPTVSLETVRLDPGLRIVPFRGEYYRLIRGREGLVRNLIYPVPDPALPFLGVHFTRKLDRRRGTWPQRGAGLQPQNAMAGWQYVGARRSGPRLSYPGFWRLDCAAPALTGAAEITAVAGRKSRLRARTRRRLVPEVGRATIFERDGMPASAPRRSSRRADRLVDDFRILEGPMRMLHVLNAPVTGGDRRPWPSGATWPGLQRAVSSDPDLGLSGMGRFRLGDHPARGSRPLRVPDLPEAPRIILMVRTALGAYVRRRRTKVPEARDDPDSHTATNTRPFAACPG